ncbi:protein SRC2-like [Dioscorea cayenensis subsp. rotundata]|uniref:Protein SRC2-like n=1 Tax=Dioscorea cayennensis subsp. rotundata TaxID=55577 RepID=A0AB40AK79_DIOCR|nr:protein SRC2-like [Dioscorea cayenensis subsp. rotundata]
MASRTLEITLISAKDLKDVNLFSKMEVYAVVSIDGDRRSVQRTTPDRHGGTNPAWNATLRLPLPPDDPARHVVVIVLRAERALGDRDVGEVHIPLTEFLSGSGDGKTPQFVSYQVRKPSGKGKGVLNISFKISDAVAATSMPPSVYSSTTAYTPPSKAADQPQAYPPPAAKANDYTPAYPPAAKANEYTPAYPPAAKASDYPQAYPPAASYPPSSSYPSYPPPSKGSKVDEPVTAYPAGPSAYPPHATAVPYGQPQGYPAYTSGYGYQQPPPPPAGYGYGAPPPGYAYSAVPPKAQKKNKFGMGLGAGLLGGALGGLLIGDMISDDGAYDAGYDAGFDDGFGF